MRITSISLALLLVTPVLAGAQERTRPPPPSNYSSPSARADQPDPALAAPSRPDRPPPAYAAPTRPPPPPGSVRPPPTGPGTGPWSPPPVYYPSPYWWGYGWGYGYEPLYPLYPSYRDYPEPWPGYGAERAHPAHRVSTTMRVTGAAGSGDSGAVGLAFAVDSSRGGFDLTIDAFAPSHGGVMAGGLSGSQDAYGFGSAHFAFPILEGPAYRLRLLAGGSWLSVPSSAYGSPTDAFGPDVGVSANLGLVGPIGIEGHARITPFPVQVFDLRAAVALRTGPFSLLGGYRVIDVAGDSRTGPAARFEGPELGVGLIF